MKTPLLRYISVLKQTLDVVLLYRMPYKQQVEEHAERIRSLTAERDSLKIEVNRSKVQRRVSTLVLVVALSPE